MSNPPPPPGAASPQWQQQSPQWQPQWQPPPRYQQPPAVAPNGQPLASFSDRFLAYLIDYAIHAGVSLLWTIPFMIWLFTEFSRRAEELARANDVTGGLEPPPQDIGPIFALFGPILWYSLATMVFAVLYTYLYWVELQKHWGGQTVGKRVMKIRVIPVGPGEPALGRGGFALRWVVQFVVGMAVPLFSLLDGLWQLWDKPLQQCLHDKAANTVVVKVG